MSLQETTNGDSSTSWIKKIAVAADGSVASNRGLEHVEDLAPRIGAKVMVLIVRSREGVAGAGLTATAEATR